jgi:hypothetical protein
MLCVCFNDIMIVKCFHPDVYTKCVKVIKIIFVPRFQTCELNYRPIFEKGVYMLAIFCFVSSGRAWQAATKINI